MKKTYSYFIICRYKKGILLSSKFAFALLLAALVQVSAYGTPLTRHNQANKNKNLPQQTLLSTRSPLSDIKVKGTVTDSKGETIIGATVGIKNGKNLAVTDINGNFTISVPDNAILTISYIGYQTQEIAVGGRTEISITLKEQEGNLNEVVVVGYT